MKVFVYLRVSTKEQLDGGGFERQLDTAKTMCVANGWTVARIFRDQQSGGNEFEHRAGLQEILSLAGECNALGIDTVVVENASRIARDLMVQEIFLSECRKRGIKVYAADCREELVMAGQDPTRVLVRQILGALAQWEKSQTVLKLQAGRRRKAREQGFPCGGPKPYGVNPSERAVVDEIFILRSRGKTLMQIRRELEERGFPTPEGNRVWMTSTIHRIYTREVARRAEWNNKHKRDEASQN